MWLHLGLLACFWVYVHLHMHLYVCACVCVCHRIGPGRVGSMRRMASSRVAFVTVAEHVSGLRRMFSRCVNRALHLHFFHFAGHRTRECSNRGHASMMQQGCSSRRYVWTQGHGRMCVYVDRCGRAKPTVATICDLCLPLGVVGHGPETQQQVYVDAALSLPNFHFYAAYFL